MKLHSIKPQFVELIPDELESGVLYISMKYATASHLCLCGCGKEVVTPFTPTDWKLNFDGRVSLSPSIGNWNFKCRSHYIIAANQVRWARDMSQKDIDAGRERDRFAKQRQYGSLQSNRRDLLQGLQPAEIAQEPENRSWTGRLRDLMKAIWQ